MSSNEAHEKLVNDILIALGSRRDCRVHRSTNGRFQRRGQWFRIGVIGSADINGFLQGGRRLEIEVKTGQATQTKEQRAWQAVCEAFGVLYVLAYSVDDAVTAVNEALSA